jgi:hypothetical protein
MFRQFPRADDNATSSQSSRLPQRQSKVGAALP